MAVLGAALAGCFVWAFLHALDLSDGVRLAPQVFEHIAATGVENPVTAVLLDFRSYDTLLELAVLLGAVLGIFALGPQRPGYAAAGAVQAALTRALAPLLMLTAGYLLWVGAYAPGGAFQAGAVLAAAGVLLRLGGRDAGGLPAGVLLRLGATAGVALFLGVGVALLAAGRPFLDYPDEWAGTLILLIETAAMLSIATSLIIAFVGGRLPGWEAGRTGVPAAERPSQREEGGC